MDQVFIINRSDRPKRLISAITELRKINLSRNITIIEAVTPEEAYDL